MDELSLRSDEINFKAALDLAKDIYKVCLHPEFQKYDPDVRHKVVVGKYPQFSQAYPIILRFIARDLKYNEKAFRKFLEKLRINPGKGMQGFIERQADYAKFLYIEDCKANGRHWSSKKANQFWNIEYEHMHKWVKKLEKDEDLAKNEFEKESQENLEKLRDELYDFVISQETQEVNFSDSDSEDEQYKNAALGLPPKSIYDVDINSLGFGSELLSFYRQLQDYEISLLEELEEKNQIIHDLESRCVKKPASKKHKTTIDEDWLVGTSAKTFNKRKSLKV